MHPLLSGFTQELTKLGSTALQRRAIYKVVDDGYSQLHSLLTPGGVPIVQVVGERTAQGLRVRASNVNPNFAGMKMGRKLYGQLFNKIKHLESDTTVSDLAANVYQRLSRIPGAKLTTGPHIRHVEKVPAGQLPHRKEVGFSSSKDMVTPVFTLSRSA